jgi:hypothetical protein
MLQLHKFRYLKPDSSSSDEVGFKEPVSGDEMKELGKKICNNLVGYSMKSEFDKKLWSNAILEPKPFDIHKNNGLHNLTEASLIAFDDSGTTFNDLPENVPQKQRVFS